MTSRPYGYIRLKGQPAPFQLANFSPKQVEAFVHNWQRTVEQRCRPEAPNLAAAEAEAEATVDEIRKHPKVAELATNLLMLVIIALIHFEDHHLPGRHVELYNRAVNTLMDNWNRWRSHAGIDAGGVQLPLKDTVRVWAAIAEWTRREKPTGVVHRAELQRKLVEILELQELERMTPMLPPKAI